MPIDHALSPRALLIFQRRYDASIKRPSTPAGHHAAMLAMARCTRLNNCQYLAKLYIQAARRTRLTNYIVNVETIVFT